MAELTLRQTRARASVWLEWSLVGLGILALLVAPFFVYSIFLMKMLCFALFACAFNLLLGYTGLLSFGHATFFGGAAYFTAHAIKVGAGRRKRAFCSVWWARHCSAWSWASLLSDGKASTSP